MASPEVNLPREPTDETNSLSNVQIEEEEIEKQPENDSASGFVPEDGVGAHQEVVWYYLTFETELPSPSYLSYASAPLDSRPSPPERPNLTKYQSPFFWSEPRKSFITSLSCTVTVLTAYTAGSYAAAEKQMMQEWQVSEVAINVGITVFTCGFGAAPMFLAPFSEINGRRPLFVITGLLFVLFQLVCAITPTYVGMILSRFLVGCSSSTFSTMVGGVVSDMYHAEDRNFAMALFSGSALLGTGLGPLVSGFIAQHTTWRWVFYLQVITCGIMMAFITVFFEETRGSILLSRKAKMLNTWYEHLEIGGYYGMMMPSSKNTGKKAPQRIRWKVKSDEERVSIGKMISVSLYRPFHLLVTEPVVFFFSLWISFSWAVLYLQFSAVLLVFETVYGFNLQQACAVFTAVCVGAILITVISVYQEKIARRYVSAKHRSLLETPEGRLYFSCIQSLLLPIGCFWFGWTGAFSSIPWIVPALAVGCATMGIFSIYLAVFNYLADSYHRYASSALAAQGFCRNMLAGAFPLFTPQMFRTMTIQGAGSFLGGVGALLTVVPWVLVFFGPKIRARSKIAGEIMNID